MNLQVKIRTILKHKHMIIDKYNIKVKWQKTETFILKISQK